VGIIRQSKRTGLCGEALPETWLFSATEAARVKAILAAEREKHRAWMQR